LRGAPCDFLEELLATPETLEKLDLSCSCSNLTSDILQCFKKFQVLKFLNISSNQNIALEDVGYLKNLEILILDNCNLTKVPQILKDLPKLRTLVLNNNKDLKDLKGLEKIETLKKLFIQGCTEIKCEHIDALQKQLRELEIISDLVVLEVVETETVVEQPHNKQVSESEDQQDF
jgi:Leucine-rich repeat (LRR) protein